MSRLLKNPVFVVATAFLASMLALAVTGIATGL
jgi:hypothetical protein